MVSTVARPGVRSNSGPVALAYEPELKVRRRLKSAPDAATRFFPANPLHSVRRPSLCTYALAVKRERVGGKGWGAAVTSGRFV